MKREIIFRGISIDTGKWVEGYGVAICEDLACVIHKQGINLLQHTAVIPETVGQYTGLKDRNGNNIFEGDIVKHKARYSNEFVNEIVIFNKPQHRWGLGDFEEIDSPSLLIYLTPRNCKGFEIIGNIHTNKELINS